jgi:hypothetical protein
MDYENLFLQQQPITFPTYKGVRYQRGYGLGNVFKRFFKWIVPIIKEKAVPVLKDVGKKVGESVISGTTNFARDALDGKDIKESAKTRFEETKNEIKSKIEQRGEGINKRKKKLIRTISKRHKKDIFD